MQVITFYHWSNSATGFWGEETGLYRLRDDPAEILANELWESGPSIQQSAVAELLAHGNPRKAAQVVRSLQEQHPEFRDIIRSQYHGLETLFDTPLYNLPSSPKEYSKDILVQYIQ